MAWTVGLFSSFVFHVCFGAPTSHENGGFLQQRETDMALSNFSFPVAISNGIAETRADRNFVDDANANGADPVLLLQNNVSECRDSKDLKTECIDRAFKGDCTDSKLKQSCPLSCGVCSNIWCQSGIFCSSDSAAHSSSTQIRYGEKCHGFCFPKSCSTSWEKCASESHTSSKAAVCLESKQVSCYVPLEHTPISDQAASQALDKLLEDLKDEPDKMNIIGKHRKDILGYLVRGIGPEHVPKAILPDEPMLKTAAAPSDELAPLAASSASAGGCAMDIAAVSVDSVFLIASITKVGSFLQRGQLSKNLGSQIQKVQRIALQKMGPGSVAAKSVYELAERPSAWKQAGATFSLFVSTVSMLSIGQVMKQIRLSLQHVSWWRWLWMGIQVAAQLSAWVLTDGLAFVAQAVSIIPQVKHLVTDAVSLASKLRSGCGSSPAPAPPKPTPKPPPPAPPPVPPKPTPKPPKPTPAPTKDDKCKERRAACELPPVRGQGSANLSAAALPRCLQCCSRGEPPASICDGSDPAMNEYDAQLSRLPINRADGPPPEPARKTVVGRCERPRQSRDPRIARKQWEEGSCSFQIPCGYKTQYIHFRMDSGSCISWVRAMPASEIKWTVKASLQLCAGREPNMYLPNAILLG